MPNGEKVVFPLPCPFWRSMARKWALLAYPLPIVGRICAAGVAWLFSESLRPLGRRGDGVAGTD